MPEIVLKNVTKRWGKFYAVDHLNLHIDDNSFITLLGPSGCGKTTILRMIAGLETPTEGQITIGDRVVFDSAAGINVPANKRKVGFLFQNYALWPNMTVYQNISFGLSNIKEELPRYDFEAMKAGELKKALQSGKRIRDLVEECRDKRGKLDEDKIYLKFMDSFTLSIYTAKELYGLKIHEAADPDAAASEKAEEYSKKLEEIRASYEAKGQSLSEQYAVTADGKTLMEERKLTKEEIDGAYEKNTGLLIVDHFKDKEYMAVPACLCKNHGPFAWGKDAGEAVHNAVVLEEVAKMAARCEMINPQVQPAPQELQDKHYLRKHGANAYYGQKG